VTDDHFNDLALRELAWMQRRIAKLGKLATRASTDLMAGGRATAAVPLALMDVECRLLAEEARSLLVKVAPPAPEQGGSDE
jgi:hypothetical protein